MAWMMMHCSAQQSQRIDHTMTTPPMTQVPLQPAATLSRISDPLSDEKQLVFVAVTVYLGCGDSAEIMLGLSSLILS